MWWSISTFILGVVLALLFMKGPDQSAADRARFDLMADCAIDGQTMVRGRLYKCLVIPADGAPVEREPVKPKLKSST